MYDLIYLEDEDECDEIKMRRRRRGRRNKPPDRTPKLVLYVALVACSVPLTLTLDLSLRPKKGLIDSTHHGVFMPLVIPTRCG